MEMPISVSRSLSLDNLSDFVQKEELDPKSQIFSDVTSLQERIDRETEGSSFPFIPLCKRIAWQFGISSLKIIRFLMDNPGILT
ncbi:MAG: hypothetical protein LBJ75_01230, partial [Puniceicoccales bacterium]|nr:hypothetical protein [Puniceicoccales bacterium]